MTINPDKLVKALDEKIKWWTKPEADPRAGEAVIIALEEIKSAVKEAMEH